MKQFLTVIGMATAVIGAGLGIAYLTLFALFDGLSTSRIVMIVMIGAATCISGILLTLWVVNRVTGRTRMAVGRTDGEIQGEYHLLNDYKPPVPALPSPRYITVPKYSVMGKVQPMPSPVLRTLSDDVEMTVPLSKLMRFLALAGPSRSEWTGDRSAYGACMAFADAHGLLDKQPNGGAAWRAEYPLEARRAWCEQFEHYPTDQLVSDRRGTRHVDGLTSTGKA